MWQEMVKSVSNAVCRCFGQENNFQPVDLQSSTLSGIDSLPPSNLENQQPRHRQDAPRAMESTPSGTNERPNDDDVFSTFVRERAVCFGDQDVNFDTFVQTRADSGRLSLENLSTNEQRSGGTTSESTGIEAVLASEGQPSHVGVPTRSLGLGQVRLYDMREQTSDEDPSSDGYDGDGSVSSCDPRDTTNSGFHDGIISSEGSSGWTSTYTTDGTASHDTSGQNGGSSSEESSNQQNNRSLAKN